MIRFQLPVNIKRRSNMTEGLNVVIPFCGQKVNGENLEYIKEGGVSDPAL